MMVLPMLSTSGLPTKIMIGYAPTSCLKFKALEQLGQEKWGQCQSNLIQLLYYKILPLILPLVLF